MIFHIRYEDRQGVFMRIMNAVSRRGLEFPHVHADNGRVCLHTNSSNKQAEQLMREWRAIQDVASVEVLSVPNNPTT